MMCWNYKSTEDKSSGYEDVLDVLKSFTKDKYVHSDDATKEQMIQEVFNIYRTKNIFPITYYNENGIKEEIQSCVNKKVEWDGDILNIKFNQGASLCRFMFPNLYEVECKGVKNNSPYYKFYDDHKLYRAIKFCLDHKSITHPVVPTAIKDGLEMLGGNVATNFSPMKAKALYEKYCPENGIIYDYSCGFGGRMLGALTSKNNYRYIGVEPCTETYKNLNRLGKYIEETTGRSKIFKIFYQGSEDFKLKENSVDFAFSSPPYFNLEKYSNEDTQCYNKFSELLEWFDGYVRPTIENIYTMLKPNKYYAVNIADFKISNKNVEFVNEWINISLDVGFEFVKEIPMNLQTRRGKGHNDNSFKKQEGIYLFKKLYK